MTLEYILRAAVSSMIKGHHAPHCFSAHVPGKGYISQGLGPMEDRADYLRQLERCATSEAENIRFCKAYAEPGYTDPERGIVFADWNVFPRGLDSVLERAGYEIEWSDEWTECTNCYRAVRTSPDCYSWRPAYVQSDCGATCEDCARKDPDAILSEFLNNPDSAITFDLDLASLGFERFNTEHYENGWFPGQDDRPRHIIKHLPAGLDYVFIVSENSQFYSKFDLWTRPEDWTEE